MSQLANCCVLFVILATSSALSNRAYAEQESDCPVLCKYTEVCAAQLNVLRRQRDIQTWKLENLQSLHERGFASWLEVRRQQFAVDSAEQKIRQFNAFADFIVEVRNRIEETNHQYDYDENTIKAVRVFMPGSNRVVGWLEGHQLHGYSVATDLNDAVFELELSKKRLVRSKEMLETTKNDPQWQKKCQLNLDLAVAQQLARRVTVEYLSMLRQQIDGYTKVSDEPRQISQTLGPHSDQEFQRLVLNVANAEINSQSQLELVKRHLQREQERLEALEKLALHGHATKKEIGQLQQHVAELRAARDQIANEKSNLQKAFSGIEPTTQSFDREENLNLDYLRVNQWPVEVLSNSSYVQYLVEQRRAYYNEQLKLAIATQKREFFEAILSRLKVAAKQFAQRNSNADRFTDLLELGQKKEIEGYEWKKESLSHTINAANEKLQVLVLEEHRFLRQAVLMSELPVAPANAKDNLTMNSVELNEHPELLVSMLASPANSNAKDSTATTIRYGYVESNILDSVGDSAELLLMQSPGFPLGRFEVHEDLLNPIALTDYSRSLDFARSRPIRIQVGSHNNLAVFGLNAGDPYRGSSRFDIAAPSLFNSPYATNSYRQNQFNQPRFFENAYPFGILRGDLRRFTTPGQIPWYLPGSPGNLRYNQFQTDFRRSPGGDSGSELLKSKNYLDLTRPLNQ